MEMHVGASRAVWTIYEGREELFFECSMDMYNFSIKLLWLIILITIVVVLITDGKQKGRGAGVQTHPGGGGYYSFLSILLFSSH